MTITIERQPGAKMKVSVSTQGKVVRVHTVPYKVTSTEQLDDYEISQQLGIDAGTPHEADALATCRGIDVTERTQRDPWGYDVTVEYSTDTPEIQSDDDPLAERVKKRWKGKRGSKITGKDRNGKPILNVVGDRYSNPPELPYALATLTYVRNEATFDGTLTLDYVNTINSTTFSRAAIGTLLCAEIDAEEQFKKNRSYWTVTYTFEYDRAGWQPKLLEEGINKKNGTGAAAKREPILDGTFKQPIREPIPLDGDGQPIPINDLPDAAVYTEKLMFREKDFTQLGLPQS